MMSDQDLVEIVQIAVDDLNHEGHAGQFCSRAQNVSLYYSVS